MDFSIFFLLIAIALLLYAGFTSLEKRLDESNRLKRLELEAKGIDHEK